jgi:hypothetical protein
VVPKTCPCDRSTAEEDIVVEVKNEASDNKTCARAIQRNALGSDDSVGRSLLFSVVCLLVCEFFDTKVD